MRLLKINVVNAHRLTLSTNATNLEEGSYLKVVSRVFSKDGIEIDPSQFRFFNLAINTDCIVRESDKSASTVTYQMIYKGSCNVYGYLDKLGEQS